MTASRSAGEPGGVEPSGRGGPIFKALRRALRDDAPVALATVTAVEAEGTGAGSPGGHPGDEGSVLEGDAGAVAGAGAGAALSIAPGLAMVSRRTRLGAKLLVEPGAGTVVLGNLATPTSTGS